MDREPKSARYCAECNKLHPAEEGDFWAESSMLGLKITYFALMDGKVYDITGILLTSKYKIIFLYLICYEWVFRVIISICRVGWMPACGDLSRHPQSSLPHLIWFSGTRHQWSAKVGGASHLATISVVSMVLDA